MKLKEEEVNLDFNGKVFKVKTDSEGYFNTKLKHFGTIPSGINTFTAKLADGQKYQSELTTGKVTIHSTTDKTFGVVSDIDDTIQKSYATNKLKAVETLFSNNYQTQKQIAGTSELYQALDKKNDGKEDGDLYYISGSPVQITGRIENFLDLHNFPEGSIDLKRMGFGKNEDSPTKQVDYKLGKLRTLFNEYR
ncbi:MAG: phosphatase domain-containing protein [Candidatus Sericytochromatia bacterium]